MGRFSVRILLGFGHPDWSMKHSVFWDVALCRSCVKRRFGGTYRSIFREGKNLRAVDCSLQPSAHTGSSLADSIPWRWRRYFPPKRLFTQHLHSVTYQKTFFIVTAVKTSNLTYWLIYFVVFVTPSMEMSEFSFHYVTTLPSKSFTFTIYPSSYHSKYSLANSAIK
jgi:hypothetical protein